MIEKIRIKLSQDKHLSDLLGSSAISFILRIVGIVLGYVFILLMSRNLGTAAVGIFTLALTVLQIASVFGRFGLDTALLRFVAESVAHDRVDEAVASYKNATYFALFLSIVLSIIIYIFAEMIAEIFGNILLTDPFKIISIGIAPLTLTYLNFETLRGMKKIRLYSFLQNVSAFLISTIALLFILDLKTTIDEIIMIFVGSVFITWGISQYWIIRIFRTYQSTQAKKLISMLNISFPMMVSSSLMLIMGWTDILMIGIYMNENSVGIYTIALKVATVTSITLMAINSMAAPKFAELYSQKDMASLQHVVSQVSRLIFWTSFPIFLLTIIFPEQILSIFGDNFEDAAWALIILSFAQFVNAASGSVGYILQMSGKEKVFQRIVILSLILNILLNVILIPEYGLIGAAMSTAFSKFFWNFTSLVYIYKVLHIKTYYIGKQI